HWVDVAVDRVVREFEPVRIVVFGSQARGDGQDGSDLDMLVVLPRTESKFRDAVAIRRILADLPIAKDIVVATPEELDHSADLRDSVVKTANAEGRVVYERV